MIRSSRRVNDLSTLHGFYVFDAIRKREFEQKKTRWQCVYEYILYTILGL